MTHFSTCRTCVLASIDCEVRAKIKTAIAGLGVGSIKHRCALYAPLYTPGVPVLVQTVAWMTKDSGRVDWEEERDPPIHWYPGHFIRFSKASVVAFIKPGTEPVDVIGAHGYPFETQRHGFVKVPISRVKLSDWAPPLDVTECSQCGSMTGVGQPCQRDPHYGALSKCLQHLTAPQEPTGSSEPALANEESPW